MCYSMALKKNENWNEPKHILKENAINQNQIVICIEVYNNDFNDCKWLSQANAFKKWEENC